MGKAAELSLVERERIARTLFQVREQRGSELHGLCPFHDDTNPSFSYNFEKDIFNCLACGEAGDLIKLWGHVKGSRDQRADFIAFCSQFGLQASGTGGAATGNGPKGDPAGGHKDKAPAAKAKDPKIPQAKLTEAWQKMEPLPATWRARLAEVRGWSDAALDKLQIRLQTCRWDKRAQQVVQIPEPDRVAIPVFDASGVVRNIRCYKPGGGHNKIISFAPGTGEARLFPAKPDPEGVVLLVEGEPDTICARSHGFGAITQTSKTKYWTKDHQEPFRNRDVVIAYDADQPGQQYAEYAAACLVRVARSVKMLVWPDFMGRTDDGQWPKDHGQDLTDFFVKHGKSADDLRFLMDTAEAFVPEGSDAVSYALDFFAEGPNGRLSFKPRLLANRVCRDMELVCDPDSGLVYRWNGAFFERYPEEHIERACLEYLGDEAQQSRVKDATFQSKRLSQVPFGRSMNDQTDWVCLKNGMLNLRTLDIASHDKKYFATYQLPVVFDPDRAGTCDRFLTYLDETVQTPGPIAQVQEFAGYCLTREVRYEKALLLLGPGADGKSKLIAVLRALVGAENCAAVSFQDLEDQFHRSSLFGKLLNISTEVGSRAMESAYFKAIVSGDPISAAFKHQDAFEFRPSCKLVFAGNRMPRILDNSDGPFRRLLPIQFKRQFLDDGDPHLEEKLMSELSEIFQWALVGLHRLWSQKRFTDCDETRQLLMDHRRSNNPVLCFVEDVCLIGDAEQVSKEKLYKSYKKFTASNGYLTLGAENFFRELYAAVANTKQFRPRADDGRRTYHIAGIGINPEVEVE